MLPEPFLSWYHTLFLLLREHYDKGLFLALLVEEAGVPLPMPGDVLIVIAGYRAATGQIGILEAGIIVILAVQLGSTILYSLSRRLGHGLLFRYGRFIHLDEGKLRKAEGWIQRRGPVMVLIGRLTPGLRTPTSIMAGVFEVPFPQFLFFATLSAVLWSVFWLSLGYFFGQSLLPVVRHLHMPWYVAVGLALLAMGGLMWWRRWSQKRRALLHQSPEA